MAKSYQRTYSEKNTGNRPDIVEVIQNYCNIAAGDSLLPDFIYHPPSFPLSYRRVWFHKKENSPDDRQHAANPIGLCFHSEKYLKPGSKIEVSIPIKNENQYLRGKVVLVRNMKNYFKIGIWLTHADDIRRVRAVEQICHIETYMKTKRYQDGPFISHRSIVDEWIKKYAATFPPAR